MKLTENSKVKKIIGWTISGLLAALYIFSASGKFMHPENMAQIHLDSWAIIIGIGEIASALLFLFPKTNLYGAFLLSSYMGGAIIVHMTTQQSILLPSVILIVIWGVTYLRNSQIFCNCQEK